MSLIPLTAVGTLVFTFVNFLTYLRSKNWNAAVTQLIAWAAGVVGIVIAAHSQYAPQITFGTQRLSDASWWTQVFLGLIATSLLSTFNELKKALDNSDSAKKAPLLPPAADASPVSPAAGGGVVELVAGSVTIAQPGVQPESRILLTALGTQQGSLRVTARRAGSFTITSTDLSDSGPVAYQVMQP